MYNVLFLLTWQVDLGCVGIYCIAIYGKRALIRIGDQSPLRHTRVHQNGHPRPVHSSVQWISTPLEARQQGPIPQIVVDCLCTVRTNIN